MNTMWKLMLAGLVAFAFAACGEEPSDGTDTDNNGSDSISDDPNLNTAALADKTSLIGQTYLVAFEQNWWNKPEDVGADIGAYVPGFLLKFTAVDPVAMTFQGLLGTADEDGSQNPCNKTAAVSGVLEDKPLGDGSRSTFFKTTAIDFDAILTGPPDNTTNIPPHAIAPIHSFELGGSFTDQGAGYKNGSVDAVMDLRDISCLFMLINNPADRNPTYICQEMKDTLDYDCEVCPFESTISNCVVMQALYFRGSVATSDVVEVPDFVAGCVDTSACN